MSWGKLSLFIAVVIGIFTGAGFAQVQTGIPPFESFGGGPDVINLGNLNVHYSMPVFSRSGRGIPFSYALAYDSSVWQPAGSAWLLSGGGLTRDVPAAVGYVSAAWRQASCIDHYDGSRFYYDIYTYSGYTDSAGTLHRILPLVLVNDDDGTCGTNGPQSATITTTDGSGMKITVTTGPSATVTLRDGRTVAPVVSLTNNTNSTQTDSNGNQITSSTSSGVTSFYDTLSSTTPVMKISGAFPSPVSYSYTAPSGAAFGASVVVSYKSYTVQTNFGCSNLIEYPPTSQSLVDKITLPDGSFYQFGYETTPIAGSTNVTGRIASITLPTEGEISYNYTGFPNNGVMCSDGSTSGFKRTTPDGTWIYSRSGTGPSYTTTVTSPPDPLTGQNNVTVVSFNGNFETERQIYQGAATGTPLETVITCYNGNTTNCPLATVTAPFNEVSVYQQFNGGLQARADNFYDTTYSLMQEKDEYDFGASTATRKTAILYGSYNVSADTCAALGNGIVDHPCKVTVTDGGGNLKSKTGYTYDGGTPTSTTSPNHIGVTGSRGNLTTITKFITSATTLSQTYTYYDTGMPNAATDVNGNQSTYSYSSASCGNSFPTGITLSNTISLSKSMAWNCTGGVLASSTDENGNTSYTNYTADNYFWRPESTKDQIGNITNLTYASLVRTESSLQVAASSYVDVVATLDTLGRPSLSQTRQVPISGTTFDTGYGTYDSVGRPYHAFMTCEAALGGVCSTPATTTSYDGANRPIKSQDGSGATVQTITYNQNDTLIDVSAPSGENDKRRQLEYDGLGRLISACELTSTANGGVACGQTISQTGYWTRYVYDPLGHLIGVCQNTTQPLSVNCVQTPSTGQQTRTYTYDMLGRMLSETNPESGTKTYTYDTTSNLCGNGAGASAGDLLTTNDAAGNCVAYYHDALHRLYDVGNNSQSATNPCKRFRYDNSTGYSGSTKPAGLVNTLGRLIEAATDSCTSTGDTLLTDEWFSYDKDGRLTDVYQSSPTSGGYYHSSAGYFANGGLETLSLLNSSGAAQFPAVTYGVDTEGRPASVSAASGQNPVSSVTYVTANGTGEPVGALTKAIFGSLDSDSFQYDVNTGRMTQYSFNVNGQSAIGNLTWNTNATLQKLAITDPFNSQDNQTCTYTYDDLERSSGANCGSVWAQTFTYDPFGNVKKSGSVSWQPSYSTASNNQYLTGWNGVSYDKDGNLLNDTFNTYTWDVYGDLATANAATVTNDAFGRMVQNTGRGFEIVYSPAGGSVLAAMQGQSLNTAYVPLPGGSTAAYLSSGLGFYFHPDWLGSVRLLSTTSRSTYPMMAYAPFGEGYAGGIANNVEFTAGGYPWTVLDPENETGSLEDFMFRRYSPVQGRWISPDPAGMGAANPASPQSWNRYAYVSNGPLNAVDPSGLWRSDVFGTGKNGDAFRDVGGAWFAAQIQEFKVEAGLDSPLQQGERVYQAQVDCAFNPGSCPKGVPGTPGGPVLVPGGAIYGSYSNKYETVSNILLGTVSASSVPQEYWDAYANAATHLVWQWWDEHSYYRSGLTEEDARANELAYRVGMDTMNIFTPCDGLQVGSILLGAEATPWLGETIGKVAYFLGNAGALASLGCD